MSEQTIAVKAKLVDEATESMKAASSIVVVDYRGLTVAEVTDLRKQLRDEGVKMQVIKNKVLERAAEKAGFDDLKETFNGQPLLYSLQKTQLLVQRLSITLLSLTMRLNLRVALLTVRLPVLKRSTSTLHCLVVMNCFLLLLTFFKHLYVTLHTVLKQLLIRNKKTAETLLN